jgi:hypothetical protein
MRNLVWILMVACSGTNASVSGNVGGLPFTAEYALFDSTRHVSGDTVTSITELRFYSYDGCAWLEDPTMPVPSPSFEIAVGLDVEGLPTTAGELALGGSGLARPADALWVVGGGQHQDAGTFTGGAISLAEVTASLIRGDLEITSPNGDYAVGSFGASHCAAADLSL